MIRVIAAFPEREMMALPGVDPRFVENLSDLDPELRGFRYASGGKD